MLYISYINKKLQIIPFLELKWHKRIKEIKTLLEFKSIMIKKKTLMQFLSETFLKLFSHQKPDFSIALRICLDISSDVFL